MSKFLGSGWVRVWGGDADAFVTEAEANDVAGRLCRAGIRADAQPPAFPSHGWAVVVDGDVAEANAKLRRWGFA